MKLGGNTGIMLSSYDIGRELFYRKREASYKAKNALLGEMSLLTHRVGVSLLDYLIRRESEDEE